MTKITIIGAGLAGCEAAWQAAQRGVAVRLIEMKPQQRTPAHELDSYAELVCSNSLKARRVQSASGLLKEELRCLNSLLLSEAEAVALPAGGALAVDRLAFSHRVTARIKEHPLIETVTAEVRTIPDDDFVVIATGPLTSGELFEDIQTRLGTAALSFFDAAAPIIELDSIDQAIAFRQSRYDRGGADYLNCPLNEEEYLRFYQALITAEVAEVHGFERKALFSGCMPVESMAQRGPDTLRFGPLKPVGLTDPRTGRRPYACVQLRQDNFAGNLYNMVGFQTRLKFGEQKRVFRLIPGLAEAEFARFGVMHRNTFLDSPRLLAADYSVRSRPGLFFAGQITGVEGYVESIASGLIAGTAAAMAAKGVPPAARLEFVPSQNSIIGALARYVSDPEVDDFQPMNANFGILPPLEEKIRQKEARNLALAERSLADLQALSLKFNESLSD